VLKDALSNNTMQRSAIRTARVTSLYRSRPLMVGVRRTGRYLAVAGGMEIQKGRI
jgi:hypothetical protein